MRVPQGTTLALWLCVMALACLLTGCPDTAANVDAAGDVASDLGDAVVDVEMDVSTQTDVSGDSRDASDVSDASDVPVPTCVPGMSIACACVDGRMGAQVCRSDFTYSPCQCAAPDAGTPDVVTSDVVLPPLGARLIAPQSVSRVTSRRPTMRWVLPDGVTRARVQVCADRPCTRMLVQQEVTGTSWRPTEMLAPGVTYWRVRGLDGDGGVAWSSATWEYVVGQRDAVVDTSFGTIKDFNGDGFDDVAVVDTGGGSDTLIYQGRSGVGASIPSMTLSSELSEVYSMGVGDFNGDGYADLATTNKYDRLPGRVQIRYGSSAGLPQEQSLLLALGSTPDLAGLLAVADVNGDGFSDVITDSETDPDTGPGAREVHVFAGSALGLATTPGMTILTPTYAEGYAHPADQGNSSFDSVGDVNGDGYADILTTYYRSRDASRNEIGRAWLVAGHPSAPMRSWIALPQPTRTYHFGHAMAGVGDLDGNGVADFAISSAEEVSIYLGQEGAFATRPVTTIPSPEGGCFLDTFGFASSIGRAGDFNGDGRADLAIGARCLPYVGHFDEGTGSAFIFPGQPGGVASDPIVFRGTFPGSEFGGGIGGIGDFNNDGIGDLEIVQATANLAYGSDPNLPTTYVLPGSFDGPSFAMAWIFRNYTSLLGVVAANNMVSRQRGA